MADPRLASSRQRTALVSSMALLAVGACFDEASRWVDPPAAQPQLTCTAGQLRCGATLDRCVDRPTGPAWALVEDCASKGLVCALSLERCTPCLPDSRICQGQDVVLCDAQGQPAEVQKTCDTEQGVACREGACVDLCAEAAIEKSNVGCEYWAVDLDNAMIDLSSNAAAQQFAVVVSNAQPDVANEVHVFQDDGQPGDASAPIEVASATVAPMNLVVFKLGPREVDGSPDGEFNTGTHTALTRHAYKIESRFPVVAYQFNPLENANVFSNDASLLKPREALQHGDIGGLGPAYVVAGWPQTIANTDDPNTNFNPLEPIDLRAFLTIVGTTGGTHVRVTTTAAVVGGGPVADTKAGGVIEAELGPFDVLNLETGGFGADFTGSIVETDAAVAVFTGSEASDAPHFDNLDDRRCCADHLEDQLDPIRTAGTRFAIAHTPSRTRTVKDAGAGIGVVPEPDWVRFVSASADGAVIQTTLPPPYDVIELGGLGSWGEVEAFRDFVAESSQPVIAMQVMASQDAAGVQRGLPGGDPSILVVPPVEQFRASYVFLTPDKYAFDFISVVAAPATAVYLDESPLGPDRCSVTPADGLTEEERGNPEPPFVVYTCQLGFGEIDPLLEAPDNLAIGIQNDGVHRLVANGNVGVVVSGFDSYVSYSYAAGTELRELGVPQ